MKRIASPNRAVDLFGPGRDGFQAAVAGVRTATELTPAWFNLIQEAVARTVEAAGFALSETDFDQFTVAIQTIAAQATLGKVTQGGGAGQVAGLVKIGAAAGGKLKADVDGIDFGNLAFEPWVAQQIAALVNSSPATLDTLNELAAALANDPNFATTMTNALAGKERKFDSGTRMLFQQSVAPTGWTKVVEHNNKVLRVVSGAASSGGTVDFTTAFVNGNVGATALTIAQMPSHNHGLTLPTYTETGIGSVASGGFSPFDGSVLMATDAIGDGATHSHTINLDVRYVDIIIASKD